MTPFHAIDLMPCLFYTLFLSLLIHHHMFLLLLFEVPWWVDDIHLAGPALLHDDNVHRNSHAS